jgi:hypothetical protein
MAIQSSSAQSRGLATLIEAVAKRRLADEYDAAQGRGEVATARDGRLGRSQPERLKATAADIGLSRKQIHEARTARDAKARLLSCEARRILQTTPR